MGKGRTAGAVTDAGWRLVALGFAALALALSGCRGGERRAEARVRHAGQATGDLREEMTSGGVTRRYLLHVPASYQRGTPVPLVVNLHGFNSNAEQEARLSGMSAKADAAGFIVVYPEGLGDPQRWYIGPRENGQADITFFRDLVAQLQGAYDIDARRIFATGISNGGGMTNRIGCELADIFAAIAPVSGDYQRFEDCHPPRPVPVVAFHGTADRLIPYDGNRLAGLPPIKDWAVAWAARNGCAPSSSVTYRNGDVTGETWDGCGADAAVTLYTVAGGGHWWPGSTLAPQLERTTRDVNATDAMWEFFVAHPMP